MDCGRDIVDRGLDWAWEYENEGEVGFEEALVGIDSLDNPNPQAYEYTD